MKASITRLQLNPLLKAVCCLVFIMFLTLVSKAGLGVPPIIVTQPAGVSVQNGDSAQIVAIVAPSLLTKQYYYWYRNGQPVSTNSNISVGNIVSGVNLAISLTISNATAASAGTYTLCVTNGVGGLVSSNANLIVLTTVVTNVVNILSSGTGLTTSGFKLQLSGPVGSNYVVAASSDLASWSSIATNKFTNSTVSFLDASATNATCRFYRVAIR